MGNESLMTRKLSKPHHTGRQLTLKLKPYCNYSPPYRDLAMSPTSFLNKSLKGSISFFSLLGKPKIASDS